MNKFIYVLLLAVLVSSLFCTSHALAAGSKTVPGDVLVVFKNPFPELPVTSESLAKGSQDCESGKHRAYIESVAKSLDAKIVFVYEIISVKNNNISALLHSDTKSEDVLLMKLKTRKDVKGASLNYVRNISF